MTTPITKAVAPAAKVARDAAYVAVGVGVIATQRVSARRYDAQQQLKSVRTRITTVQTRINEAVPRVRDEAQATAERVFSEAADKVRNVIDRRKNVTTL
jgi:gas vesicle protein